MSAGLPALPHAYGQPPPAWPVADRPSLFILALLPSAPALAMMRHSAPAAVQALGRRKSMLGDIAVLTAGTFFSEDLGRSLESVELSELGRAKRIVVTKDETTIIEGAG